MKSNIVDALYQHIIQKWTHNQPLDQKIVTIFKQVRDIPYGTIGSRNPLDVYHKNMGTCSGKHALLKALYTALGIEVKDFIVLHNFNNLPIKYPNYLKTQLTTTTILDPHNFIKIKVHNKWLLVDVTWDKPLKKLGFPINENWDGKSNLNILVSTEQEFYETDNAIYLKQKLLKNLTITAQKEREIFLKKFSEWLSCERRKL